MTGSRTSLNFTRRLEPPDFTAPAQGAPTGGGTGRERSRRRSGGPAALVVARIRAVAGAGAAGLQGDLRHLPVPRSRLRRRTDRPRTRLPRGSGGPAVRRGLAPVCAVVPPAPGRAARPGGSDLPELADPVRRGAPVPVRRGAL